MTPLKKRLIDLIRTGGPMTVSDYFATCLLDPRHGYYLSHEPFGRGGDFITAPEVSQLFGEMIAVWVWQNWQAAGRPALFALVEIGPGRGTLMVDMVRALSKIGGGAAMRAAKVRLVEASPRLVEVQRKALEHMPGEPRWLSVTGDLPDLPSFIVANELFDAIPVRQCVRTSAGWRERVVALNETGDDLVFAVGPGVPDPGPLPSGAEVATEGTVIEVAPARGALMAEIAARIAHDGGAGLFIDYGSLEGGFGETLQAVKDHRYDPALANPGEADLTSHVDFQALENAARRAGLATRTATQGSFLLGLGLLERAGALGADKDAATQARIRSEVERLAGPDQMGELFKVLAIGRPGALWMP